MPFYVRVSGVWKEVTTPAVNVSSTWKNITAGYVNVSGTWKQFYSAETVTLVNRTGVSGLGSPALVQLMFNQTGTTSFTGTTHPDWVSPAPPSGTYHIRFTNGAGDQPTGESFNTWLQLAPTTTRVMTWNAFNTTADGNITVEISDDGGSTILDSATYTCDIG